MSDKLKKILVVIFLTLLIWAWAFMSLEKNETFTGTLEVSPSADPSLLVTLTSPKSFPQTEISLTSLTFRGAPSGISDLSKRNNLPLSDQNREPLDFYYDPAEQGRTEGAYNIDLLEYLQKSSKIQELALTLESCTPPDVTVTVEQLVEKELPIECRNENGSLIPDVKITPAAFAKIYVRKGDNDPVIVKLTQQQSETARKQPVEVTPYVELGAAKVRREAASPVQITLLGEEQLKPNQFKTPKPIGITMSQELQEKYKVTIIGDAKARETTTIFATDEAFKAYNEVAFPLRIEITEIKDTDIGDLEQPLSQAVIYNFPPKYVRSGEIELAEQLLRTVDIKIEPLSPEGN